MVLPAALRDTEETVLVWKGLGELKGQARVTSLESCL